VVRGMPVDDTTRTAAWALRDNSTGGGQRGRAKAEGISPGHPATGSPSATYMVEESQQQSERSSSFWNDVQLTKRRRLRIFSLFF
jgi:hypothetical protein